MESIDKKGISNAPEERKNFRLELVGTTEVEGNEVYRVTMVEDLEMNANNSIQNIPIHSNSDQSNSSTAITGGKVLTTLSNSHSNFSQFAPHDQDSIQPQQPMQNIILTTLDGESMGLGDQSELPQGFQFVRIPGTFPSMISSNMASSSSSFAGVSRDIEYKVKDEDGGSNVLADAEYDIEITNHPQPQIQKTTTLKTLTNKQNQSNLSRKNLDPFVTVKISDNESVDLPKYYFQNSICRVCLLDKENTTSIFENVNVDEKGLIENSRGSKAVRFNIFSALKTLLDIDVKVGDGLPSQICSTCLDALFEFSAFRLKVSLGQNKLTEIVRQVKDTTHPTFLLPLGETDFRKTEIYKHPDWISNAKEMLAESEFSHLVKRSISDRVWDQIFTTLSLLTGVKSNKLKSLESYASSNPYVTGWFCPNCNVTIHDGYANHFQKFHGITSTTELLYPCDICGDSYPLNDSTGLTQNYAYHWFRHFFFHECTNCSKRFPSSKSLWMHKKSAHGSTTKNLCCNVCDKHFAKKSHLEAHKKTHMEPADRVQHLNICEICGKGLTGSLQTHLDTVHSVHRPFACELCKKTFKRKEILAGHRDTVHLNIKKYQCEVCGEHFKSHSVKAVHLLRHKGEKPHLCTVCGKSFYSTHALKSHSLKHKTIGDFKCSECGKLFKRKLYLNEHLRLHSGEKPHECQYCGKFIRMKSNYYKHLKVHERQQKVLDESSQNKKGGIKTLPIELKIETQ